MFALFRSNRLFINIILASIAMIGIIILLTNWFVGAYRLKQELFDYRVNVALKSIVNQMIDKKHETQKAIFCEHFCKYQNQNVIEHIDKNVLDSIVNVEFEALEIDRVYEYAVFKKRDSLVILKNTTDISVNIFSTPYCVSLSCVSVCTIPEDNFYLAFYFPEKDFFILRQMLVSILMTIILFFVLIFSYYRITLYYYKLLKLSFLKADFVNNLTHEFKTPIATVSLASDMLKNEGILNDIKKRDKYLQIIKNENERLKLQVNKILHISLIEKEELAFNFELTDAHAVIEQCVANYDILIKSRNGHFVKQMHAKDFLINADKLHFYNVLSNLIDNALKYNVSEKPEVRIETKNINNKLEVIVSDNGIGISKEYKSKIFSQFFRVPTGNVHDIKGFGLGLFYVKTIIVSMGGDIIFNSVPDKGTSFILKLPLIENSTKD